jgi:hypothetical protein
LKEAIENLNQGKNNLLYGNNSLQGKLTVVVDNTVIEINAFDLIVKPGKIILHSDEFRLRGGSLIEEVETEPKEKKEEKSVDILEEAGMLTDQEILDLYKKEKDGENNG